MDANREESSNSKGKSYFVWDTKMDKILATRLIEQLNQGNKLEGRHAWKPTAWTIVINAIKEHCGKVVTKQNVVSRLKTWEKHYELLSPLLLKSGGPFSWDHLRNRLDVHEDHVWQDHVKANSKLGPYRKKEIENWEDICVLFSQDRANGEGARTANEEEEEEVAGPEVDPDIEIDTIGESANSANPEVNVNVVRPQQTTSTSSSSRGTKRKASDTQLLCKAVSQMADSLTSYFTMGSVGPRRANPNEVLEELHKVQDLDRNQVLKAFDLLRADIVKFESFCALPNELKHDWLLMHLQ